jgi:sarcosine oxidase subunit beta
VKLPGTADAVVIGGGIIGTSIAFHLARMGAGQVVLLERKHLAAGATGLSCGLVRQHADNPLDAQIVSKSMETFQHFNDVVGGDCGWVSTGFLYLISQQNLEAMVANIAMLQELGIRTSLFSPGQIRELAPYLSMDEPTYAAYEPDSGYADPYSATMGFARGARRHGAHIAQDVEVTGFITGNGRLTGVQTPQGEISTPVAVNAAGPWGGLVAAMAGVPTDLAVEHHQVGLVEVPPDVTWPHLTVIDTLGYTYFRPETGRLTLIGASFANRIIAADQLETYSQDLNPDTQYELLERFCARFPGMEEAGVRKGHAGVYINTQDLHGLLGPVPTLEGFYLATGLSGQGFKMAPVVGQAMAELILVGQANVVDITPLRVTRFEEGQPFKGLHPYR